MAEGTVAGSTILKVSIEMTWDDQRIQTGWYLRRTVAGALVASDVEDAFNKVDPWVTAHFQNILNASCSIDRISVIDVQTKEYFGQEFVGRVGGYNAATASTMLAVNMSMRSAKRSRHRNGRMFWPLNTAPFKGKIDGVRLPDYVNGAASFVTEFCGSEATNRFKAVVVAQARPATPNRPAIEHSWIDVDTVKVNQIVTALRRRKLGVGA